MTLSRFICVGIVLLIGTASRSEAGGPGWRGGRGWGWRGGGYGGYGGVVIVTPGYYYTPYPYYYGPYYDGYPAGSVYYENETGGVSIATAVQEQLSRFGYYKGPIDGIVGAGTRAAIAAYQRRHGLDVTGTIDTPLLRSLRL